MQAVQWWQKAPPRQCELPTLPTSPNTPAPVGWEPYLRTLKSALTSPPPRPRQRTCAALGAPAQEDREVGHAQYRLVQDQLAPRAAETLSGLPQDVVEAGVQQEQGWKRGVEGRGGAIRVDRGGRRERKKKKEINRT